MARIEKTVFISYRSTDRRAALLVFKDLTHHEYDVFIDYDGIASGDFERAILDNINARAHFVLVLTPTALDRCGKKGDWLRLEIEAAIAAKRNIVPLFFDGFSFSSPATAGKLTGSLSILSRYNGLEVPDLYFDEAMQRLRSARLDVPIDAVLHPPSPDAVHVAEEQKRAAAAAPAKALGLPPRNGTFSWPPLGEFRSGRVTLVLAATAVAAGIALARFGNRAGDDAATTVDDPHALATPGILPAKEGSSRFRPVAMPGDMASARPAASAPLAASSQISLFRRSPPLAQPPAGASATANSGAIVWTVFGPVPADRAHPVIAPATGSSGNQARDSLDQR
jgi:hypothetical protein